jgi:hypothetical protein
MQTRTVDAVLFIAGENALDRFEFWEVRGRFENHNAVRISDPG